MRTDIWTAERIELLTQMRARAIKAAWEALNKLPGPKLTKSAVSGKRDRMFGVRRPIKTQEEKAAALNAKRERNAAAKREKRAASKLSLGIGPQVQAINRRHDRVAMHERSRAPEGSLAFKVINGIKKKQKLAWQPGIDPEPFVCQDAADVIPLRLSLSDLERRDGKCRWPYDALPDEPGEGSFRFCGHVCLDGSYCFSHKMLSMGRGTNSERRATDISKVRAA